MASLLQEGLLRSVTLRRLAERLEAGDVIVYLELQPRLHTRLSGCVTWMDAPAASATWGLDRPGPALRRGDRLDRP